MKQRNLIGWLSIAIPVAGIPLVMLIYNMRGQKNLLLFGEQGFYVMVYVALAGAVAGAIGIIYGRASGKGIGLSVTGLVFCLALIAAPAALAILLVSH